jgi:Survival motor neuron (SMN) interacting protein 1 (SIP1)
MRDRDRWWAFIRGDVEWENVPGSQSHAKGAKKKKQNQQPVEYEESFSQGEMHSWVVYEEKLSWDHPEEDGVIALSYGGEDTQPEGMEEEGEDGKVLDRNFSFRAGKETSGEDVLPTPSESPRPAPGIKSRSATPDDGFSPREPTHELLSLLDQARLCPILSHHTHIYLAQTTTFHLLKYFSQWIKGRLDHSFLPPPPPPPQTHPVPQSSAKHVYDFTPCHGRWIFALLCHLDEQLTSDQISLLRNMARDAMQLIKEERSLQKTASLNKASCFCIWHHCNN